MIYISFDSQDFAIYDAEKIRKTDGLYAKLVQDNFFESVFQRETKGKSRKGGPFCEFFVRSGLTGV